MGLRIATNVASISAQRVLNNTSQQQARHYTRIASGNRIATAADDAAGLSIAENLRGQIRSMRQAERNANDGISFVQVAEGGMSEISNILIRLRELSIQAASDTIGDRERGFIDQEFQSLTKEVDRIANVTNFNGTPLLNAQAEKSSLEFQVGTRSDEADRITFDTTEADVRASSLGIEGLSTASIEDARGGLNSIDEALARVNGARARMGAMQNKLQATVNNLGVTRENLAQARSRVTDTELAEETSELVRENILQTAGVSILAQANNAPTQALKLV
ncbi:MAG: flagellin [Bacteriovoracia bacterium]